MTTLTLEFALDAEVIPRRGPLAGRVGIVDEIDEADPVDTYRVAFGNTVKWFGANDLKRAGVAR